MSFREWPDHVQQFKGGRNVWQRAGSRPATDYDLCADCAKAGTNCPAWMAIARLQQTGVVCATFECPDFQKVEW